MFNFPALTPAAEEVLNGQSYLIFNEPDSWQRAFDFCAGLYPFVKSTTK